MDELVKQRLMYSLVAGNLAVMLFQIVFNSGLLGGQFSPLKLAAAVGVGVIIGAVTFVATKFLQG